MVHFQPAADSGGNCLQIVLVGADHQIASAQRSLDNAYMDDVSGGSAVLVLRYFEDLSDAEIAAILDCGVGTVRSQASRGLERLRRATGLRPDTASELSHTGEHDERS